MCARRLVQRGTAEIRIPARTIIVLPGPVRDAGFRVACGARRPSVSAKTPAPGQAPAQTAGCHGLAGNQRRRHARRVSIRPGSWGLVAVPKNPAMVTLFMLRLVLIRACSASSGVQPFAAVFNGLGSLLNAERQPVPILTVADGSRPLQPRIFDGVVVERGRSVQLAGLAQIRLAARVDPPRRSEN